MKKNKNGFTLLELVIVIAVVAILAAILIPTFAGILNRSKLSNDIMICKTLNTVTTTTQISDSGKPQTMHDALSLVAENGFTVEKIKASNPDCIFVYDGINNRFFVYDYVNNKVTFKDEETSINLTDKKTKVNYWIISDTYAQTNENLQGFSVYLKDNYKGPATLDITTGLDVGTNSSISSINYTNTGAEQTVVICTNGGELNINAPADTVKHYGSAQVVTLTAVSENSFYANGKVAQVSIKKGRLVLTNNEKSSVDTIYIQSTGESYDNIVLATQDGAELPKLIARDNVTLPTGNDAKKVVTIQTNVNNEGKNPSKTETINLYATQGTSGNDVYEATSGYNVTDLALLVVEASSNTAKQQAAQQISDPAVVAQVSESKATFEVYNDADLKRGIDTKVKHMTIMNDFTASSVSIIKNSVIIEGENKTITSSANRILRIGGNNIDVSIRNLNMISTYTSSDSRCISIDSNYNVINLNLIGCSMECGYYALNITGSNGSGSRNITINIDDCTIKGYAAINNHASSSTIIVNNSTLIGYNDKSYAEGNSFATIVFDGGNYLVAGSTTYSNKIVVNNSTVRQVTFTNNFETAFSSQYGNVSSEAHFNNCKIEHEGENAKYFNYAYPSSNNVTIYIDGEVCYEGEE